MRDIIDSYIRDGIGIIELLAVLVVGAIVVGAWVRTKSVMTTIGAMAVGALVLAFILNLDWVGRKAGEDIRERENGAAVTG